MTWPLEMTQQQVEDEAAVYCPVAVHYIKTGSWENAARVLLAALKSADIALQTATPGGSEYVGNVDRCAEMIREMKSDAMKWRLQQARRKHL